MKDDSGRRVIIKVNSYSIDEESTTVEKALADARAFIDKRIGPARTDKMFGEILNRLKQIELVGTAKEYMTLKEAAAYCSVSETTIKRWVRDYGLPVTKPTSGDGGSLFHKPTVDGWLADRKRLAPARHDDILQAASAKLRQRRAK